MDLATFLVQCLNAVQYGLLLFLVASGLTQWLFRKIHTARIC